MSERRSDETSAAAEAYRVLRSSVKFATGEQPVRTVLVVDIDRDAPSGVAEELGAAFARAGDRTAVVLTDARHRDDATGFGDLLLGGSVESLDLRESSAHFTLIPPGQRAQADLLASDRVGVTLSSLTDRFDYVILSTASLPEHSDALGLAPRVDATILVVTSGKTRRPRAIEARDALERVGARILGVVMVEGNRRRFW